VHCIVVPPERTARRRRHRAHQRSPAPDTAGRPDRCTPPGSVPISSSRCGRIHAWCETSRTVRAVFRALVFGQVQRPRGEHLHRDLVTKAAEEGLSLNSTCCASSRLADSLVARSTASGSISSGGFASSGSRSLQQTWRSWITTRR
jgi:hypothetical protein